MRAHALIKGEGVKVFHVKKHFVGEFFGLEVASDELQPFSLRSVELSEGFERQEGRVDSGSCGIDVDPPVRSAEYNAWIGYVDIQPDCGEVGEVPEIIERPREVVPNQGAT